MIRWLHMLCVGFSHNYYQLKKINTVTAKTTIRLWHELHVEKKVTHDFLPLLAPRKDHLYFAAVRYDEIRAIAQCKKKKNNILVQKIAYPPAQNDAIHYLLIMLNEQIHGRLDNFAKSTSLVL